MPSQQAKWLGFNLDLEQGQILVPEEKIDALKANLSHLMSKVSPKARNLASVIGKIMSMSLAIGPVSRLMTRSMNALLNSRQYWNQPLSMTPEVKAELQFWNSQLELINGKEI